MPPRPEAPPRHIGFLLLHNYSMIAFANALEVLRMANYLSRRTLYRWTVAAAPAGEAEAQGGDWPGLPVAAGVSTVDASNGLQLVQDGASLAALAHCEVVFVCGGVGVQQATTEPVRALLRRLAARGVALGALCTGTHALAAAGVLDGYRCAVHWENLAALREAHPKVQFAQEVFLIDRDRLTASGGTAPLHLMLHLVRGHHGQKLAVDISEQFIVDRMRAPTDQQRLPQPECIGPGYEHLTEAAELMAANIEEPLPLSEIAAATGVSLRQLERLFHRYYSLSPAQHYMNLRLRRARELLMHTAQPIMQITVACGFQSSSHFCKAYRALFGHAPSEDRRRDRLQPAAEATAAVRRAPRRPPVVLSHAPAPAPLPDMLGSGPVPDVPPVVAPPGVDRAAPLRAEPERRPLRRAPAPLAAALPLAGGGVLRASA
ncbi:MAG: hypothetical protein RIQ53_2208 [Pseudomonadota bacterium]